MGASATSGHPTVAWLTSGAIVEREVPTTLGAGGVVTVALHQPDFTTAERVSQAINGALGRRAAKAVDAGTVSVALTDTRPDEVVHMVTAIERVEVTVDTAARVVSARGDGDDMIVETVAGLVAPDVACVVVTADRELRRRCVAEGAEVAGPRWLLDQLDVADSR